MCSALSDEELSLQGCNEIHTITTFMRPLKWVAGQVGLYEGLGSNTLLPSDFAPHTDPFNTLNFFHFSLLVNEHEIVSTVSPCQKPTLYKVRVLFF